MDPHHTTDHPVATETHLECPRCRHHSIVQIGEQSYACLNCGFKRSFDQNNDANVNPGFPWILLVIFLLLALSAGL